MKKIVCVLLAVMLSMMIFTACGNTTMTMGTGGTGGTYYGYGGILGNQIKTSSGITVNVVSTDGSKANILGIDAGNYQLATVQSDVIGHAINGAVSFSTEGPVDSFRVIGALYEEPVQIVTMNPEIKSVADLVGKKVSIGASGSGVYFNAIDVLAAAGLTENDIIPQYQSFNDSTDALKDGKIDAAFIVAGPPTPAVSELFATNKAYLIPVDGEIGEKLMTEYAHYTEFVIPAGTYDGLEEDIHTVTVKATLIVSASASEDDVYNITKAIFDNVDAITAAHAKGAELSLENATTGMVAPFHKGAAKYFAEKGITVESK
ncbi:MAG: TAXI family TRAP transporter solute-binding subunit [Ruminococcaceae bacterium]|nr:TAXI family TRAP transporter solute-binding subunit [Oscillospiraceae bacterium]